MKILYITTIGSTMDFFKSFIKNQLDIGNHIDIATNENDGRTKVATCYREWGCQVFHIDTSRSPISFGNIRAIKQIRDIVSNRRYNIVHCHTPLAAMATRIACKKLRKNGLKVIYTVHGFHFYTGAPLMSWLIYYPIEKWLSKYTDVLITINKEDYNRAKKNFYSSRIEYIPGVGINLEKFKYKKENGEKIRAELRINNKRTMLLSVGELNKNKNHEIVIRAIKDIPNITYVIVGRGELGARLLNVANEYNVDLKLVGYRTDVEEFYSAADVYILPSIREGLNVSLMEAMASGVACCASKIRGNEDLIDKPLFRPSSMNDVKYAIRNALDNRDDLIKDNVEKINGFRFEKINKMLNDVYSTI
ncbi:putative glycosyl transferase family 1 protein [Selenomonas ruminantium subsp. lactilytica TAM6421]|uniref:Putative glycosyl transferase family 1 protein n=1 Tax=Selenomonas ruminantium subsp. lactilytica (strain NBRC 103574 / TAM6421) TaxID=927704 RepID=I0GUG0_SELRL|nr:glycosyltransferase [Selenomonas ruminantium]BAL84397.1 putative glycosyl transferase family 1 protein [Selenomonas ruminantium subsp. lactilytica TAM6421]